MANISGYAQVLGTHTGEIKKQSETEHTAIFTPGTGRKFVVKSFLIVTGTASKLITLEDGTTAWFVTQTVAGTPLLVTLPGIGYESSTPNNKLQIKVGEVSLPEVIYTFFGEES